MVQKNDLLLRLPALLQRQIKLLFRNQLLAENPSNIANELGMIVRVDFVETLHVDDDDFLRVIIQKAVDLVEGLFCRLGV